MRAAIYARYSSENQRETSLEDQVRLCREEAIRRDFTIAQTWQDRELSGQVKDRPGLLAMLAAAERHEFDVLIVDDTSRLSRDTSDALQLLKRLRFWGVELVARSDSIDTLNGARNVQLLYCVRSIMNEEYLRNLAEATRRGQEGAVRRGYTAGGLAYAYRLRLVVTGDGQAVGSHLEIYEPEAEIVRRIFRLRVGEGELRPLSLREIVFRINADRIPPPGARWRNRTKRQCATWTTFAVRGILGNPIYTGRVVWNRTRWIRHPDTRRRLRRARPQDEWVERRDESLRVVTDELWHDAQRRALAARLGVNIPEYRFHGRAKYLLSGFVLCGVCGAHYVIANRTSYRCAGSRNRGPVACTNHRAVSRRRLEGAIVAALRDHLYTPESLRLLVAEVRAALLQKVDEHRRRGRLDSHDQGVAQVETEIEHIKQAIALGKATRTLLEMLEEREARRAALMTTRSPAQNVEERLARTLEQLPALVERAIADLHALLAERQVDKGKELLALLIEGITLRPVERGLEAEIRGNVEGLIKLQAPGKRPGPECNFVGSGGRI